MQNRLAKFQTGFQRLKYTKLFRFPAVAAWKLYNREFDSKKKYLVSMRMGHHIELCPTGPYLERVIVNRSYHDQNVFALTPFLQNSPVIIDIGANIGLLSCAYAHYFKSKNPKVYAIEALQRNFLQLKRNIELNKLDSVQAVRLAMGNKSGEINFELPSVDYMGNAVGNNVLCEEDITRAKQTNSYRESVPMRTLDEWAVEQNIDRCDFIKLDIEGAELLALEGGRKFISRMRPLVQCEFNRYFLEKQNLGIRDYIDFFNELNYQLYWDAGDYYLPVDPNDFKHSLVDVIFIPNEALKKVLDLKI